MTQVVDASVVVSTLVDTGPEARWCEERLAEQDLAAPHLLPFEVANVIRRTVRRGAVDPSLGTVAMQQLDRLALQLVPFALVSDRVWELRANLTAYDAAYVALAEVLGGRLVTLDARLAGAPGIRCDVIVAPAQFE